MGTAGWTDKTLIESGWYPEDASNPEKRLRYYATQFPLVEVDSAYYALPAEQTAEAWADRTPAHFTFNVKAFSLFTQHPTPVRALPYGPARGCGQGGQGARLPQGRRPEADRRGLEPVPRGTRAAAFGGQARRDPAAVPALVPDRPREQAVHP